MKLYCIRVATVLEPSKCFGAECFVSRETLDSYLIWCRQMG